MSKCIKTTGNLFILFFLFVLNYDEISIVLLKSDIFQNFILPFLKNALWGKKDWGLHRGFVLVSPFWIPFVMKIETLIISETC